MKLRSAVFAGILALSSAAVAGQTGGGATPPPSPPVRVGGDVRPPEKIKDARPVYPAEAQRANVQGIVILEITIDETGRVANAVVKRSIPALDEAAIAAVKQWEYTPTLLDGKPVRVIATVTVNFAMQSPLQRGREGDRVVPAAAAALQTVSQTVRAGRALTPTAARALEDRLAIEPNDTTVRQQLLGYYFAAAARLESPEAARVGRRRQILWMIEHAPEDPVGMLSEMTIDPAGHALADPEGYTAARAPWKAQSDNASADSDVLRHAAYFFRLHDKPLALACLERAQSSPPAVAELGAQYAITILGITMINSNGLPMAADAAEANGDAARAAADALLRSGNVTLLRGAGSMLAQYGTIVRALSKGAIDREPLAENILLKVQDQATGDFATPKQLAELYKRRALTSSDRAAGGQWFTEAMLAADRAAAASDQVPFIADWRLSLRLDAARAALQAGQPAAARRMAETALAGVADEHDVKFGQAVHDGHAVLGRAALASGDLEEAKAQLLRAGQVQGGGTLTSFGPNMSLAKELVEHGERDAVVKYLEQCRSFWKDARLDVWIRTIQEGKTPDFGANLLY